MGFPKHVYKRGTGKKVENERIQAESTLVNSAEELEALGAGWCDSPVDTLESAKPGKPEPKVETKIQPNSAPVKVVEVAGLDLPPEPKPTKKVK